MTLKNAYLIVEEKAENISFKKETGKTYILKAYLIGIKDL